MHIEAYAPLKERHSFHCEAAARFWAEYDTPEELAAILRDAADFGLPITSVGGGCNLLFTEAWPGILLHSKIKEISIVSQDGDGVSVKVGSGVVWDDFVAWSIAQGLCGVENLSGIPGLTGAVPVQNIGAYGMEAKETIEKVEVMDRDTLEVREIPAADCRLGYRDSRFKHEWKDKYVVLYVSFRLCRLTPGYRFRLSYGRLEKAVSAAGGPSLETVRQSVLAIRSEKLPDPSRLGNAGSFFMNPVLDRAAFEALQAKFPDIPSWTEADGRVKVSAAWLIERSGWKGKALGQAGCYEKQPLVLVNLGGASGADIVALYERIAADVKALSGLELRPETVILP